jgi:hypothetical protein
LTPEQLEKFIHVQSIVGRQEEAAEKVRDVRAYYDGDHPTMLTQRQQEFLGPLLTESEWPFSHNLVKSVIDTLRERLEVNGFTVNGESPDDSDEAAGDPNAEAAGLFWDWWVENRMDSQQVRLYRRTMRDGTSFVMVDFDQTKQIPRLTLHHVDDGTVGVSYHRDPGDPNVVMFANRYWYTFDPLTPGETGIERKTTYLPGEIRKYKRNAKTTNGWEPTTDPEDGDTWPIPWVDASGAPLGVALIEFQNPGGSEIGQIIPLQNALNKAWLDLIAAADAQGFPVMAIEYADSNGGLLTDDDDIEGTDEFRIAPGRAIELFGAHLNRIPGADLSSMMAVIDQITNAISGVSRVPSYYLRPIGGGEVPSGEALKQLESGLVKRAQEKQLVFGQSWQDVFTLAAKLAETFGGVNIPDPMTIATQWEDPNVRNELGEAQTAQIHKLLNVPDQAIWRRLGYSPEEIAGFRDDARLERAQDVASIASAVRADQQRNAPQTNPQRGGA